MSTNERRGIVWSIKKKLHQLTATEAYTIATSLGPVEGLDATQLSSDDEESCVEYLTTYLTCPAISGRDDEGLPILKRLKSIIDGAITSRRQSLVSLETEADVGEPGAQTSRSTGGTSERHSHTVSLL